MYVDAVTTAALVEEFNDRILGGRVQSIVEVDEESIGMEIYAGQRHYLLISIHAQSARCHLVTDKLRRGVEHPSPLGLLLRKYVEGARLDAVTQPPWERILHLDFSSPEGETRLVIETMDKRSNILLIAEGEIMDCARRVGAQQNRYRVMLPGKPYVPPPPQKKLPPENVTTDDLRGFFVEEPEERAWKLLVAHIAGISPLYARELIFRASGDQQAAAFDLSSDVVYDTFRRMLADTLEGRWSPCVAAAPDANGFTAFAAYSLTHLEHMQPIESVSAAMVAYFGAPVGLEAYSAGKEGVRAQVDEARSRARRKLAALNRQLAGDEAVELLRKKGELLFAYAATMDAGLSQFEAQYDPDGPLLSIELDPALSATENARAYFSRYEKSKRAYEDVPKLQRTARREAAYLEQMATDLDLAESWPEIDAVRDALQEGGYWRGERTRGPRGGKPGIRRFTTEGGFVILVGRNASQNQQLLAEKSSPPDLWLHARGIPGSHVIIRNDGRPIPDSVIEYAASLAGYYSSGRGDTTLEIDVTERRYVRPIKGGKPGMATYKNERTLSVRPQKPDQV